MLWSIIAAVFQQQELFIYGMFLIGFFIAIIPVTIQKIPLQPILSVIIPVIALHLPLPIPISVPGLIRLSITVCFWIIILISASWIGNHAGQTGK